jgi:hypothetical protein
MNAVVISVWRKLEYSAPTLPVSVPIVGASGHEAKEKEVSVAMIEHDEMKSLVLGLVRERFDSAVADGLTVDMV